MKATAQWVDLSNTEEVKIIFNKDGNNTLLEYRAFSRLFNTWDLIDLDQYAKDLPEEYADLLERVSELETIEVVMTSWSK